MAPISVSSTIRKPEASKGVLAMVMLLSFKITYSENMEDLRGKARGQNCIFTETALDP